MINAVMPIRRFVVPFLVATAFGAQFTPLTITTAAVPNGAVGVFYSAGISSNGDSSCVWGVSGGLPPGIALTQGKGSSATISGTPTAAGTFNFTATVTQPAPPGVSVGGTMVASMSFSITIAAAFAFNTTSPLPPAMAGVNYQTQFSATGGSLPYTFSSVNLPPGLQMTTNGALFGTPTTASNYNFNVAVTDGKQNLISAGFALDVTPALVFSNPSPLPPGTAGAPYSQTISVSGGTQPYIYSITDTSPPGVLISKNGNLAGTPSSTGTYKFTVQVTDSLGFMATKQYSVTFAAATPLLQVSPLALTFNSIANGDTPLPQAISIVSSNSSAVPYAIGVDAGAAGTAAPAWISVVPVSGGTPARILVSVNAALLQGNTGKATLHITVPQNSTQSTIDVAVTFNILGGAPLLQAVPTALHFGARFSSPGIQQQAVIVSNVGGGGAQSFNVSITGNSSWLSVTPTSGQAGNNNHVLLMVKADSTSLAVGDHHDILHISGPGALDIPVDLFVSSSGPLISLGVTGVRFLSRQGSGSSRPQSVAVLNLGDAATTVNWSASLVTGSDWLSISNPNGTATPAQPGSLVLVPSSAVSGFPAGPRYALVRVADPNAPDSPVYLGAVLDNQPVTSPALADPSPAGLYFTSKLPANAGSSQQILIYTSSVTQAAFQVSTFTNDGAPWLAVGSASGVASTNSPGTVTVTVTPPAASGIYTGYVNIGMGGQLVLVNVTLVVLPSTAPVNVPSEHALAAGACTPTKIAMTETGIVNNFSVPAGWPATLIAQLNDDCGNPITNGAVMASFNNGDSPVSLRGDQTTNIYSTTWQPGVVFPSMTITLTGSAGTLPPAIQNFTGAVNGNATPPPVLLPNGTLDIFFDVATANALGAGLAPGNVAQVYGSGLGSRLTGSTVPLEQTIDGTYMLVGQYMAPLYFISDSPIAAQIPFELAPNQQYAAIASVNGALSLPITITVVPVQPGIAVRPDATAEAQHLADYSLITAAKPAKPGEPVILYLAGMGATNPSVASGAVTPGAANTVVPATVTIDGQTVIPDYAGLTPDGIGLYQINFTVPKNARTGNLNVIVTQNGVISNTAILPVSN